MKKLRILISTLTIVASCTTTFTTYAGNWIHDNGKRYIFSTLSGSYVGMMGENYE